MIFVRAFVARKRKGDAARMTREKLHPLANAKAIPDIVIENAITIVPVFSPRAFDIA
jgi:hypothetical protein